MGQRAHRARQGGAGNPYLVLKFLSELGVRLPATLDTNGKIAAALRAPRVFPSTVLVRADGTVAKVLPRSSPQHRRHRRCHVRTWGWTREHNSCRR